MLWASWLGHGLVWDTCTGIYWSISHGAFEWVESAELGAGMHGGLVTVWLLVTSNAPRPLVGLWGCHGQLVWGLGWYGTLVGAFAGRYAASSSRQAGGLSSG